MHEGRRQTARREDLGVNGQARLPGDHGNGGIIRRPIRAMVLPDRVVLGARLDAAVKEITAAGGKAISVAADVTKCPKV